MKTGKTCVALKWFDKNSVRDYKRDDMCMKINLFYYDLDLASLIEEDFNVWGDGCKNWISGSDL